MVLGTRETQNASGIEWPTLGLIILCYAGWFAAIGPLADWNLAIGIVAAALFVAFHSSLQHEVIHGHPTQWQWLNDLMVAPALTILIPYMRFKDTHIAHHHDAALTDPYEDPESNFLHPNAWSKVPGVLRVLMTVNNCLAGRLIFGPAISQVFFILSDIRTARSGDRRVLQGWLWHIPAVLAVVAVLLWIGTMPIWAYLISAYFGISLLKIRTFAEHRAHELVRGRTVIIEDRGPLALLFLNNNLHAVHHMHPQIAWYDLPARFRANRAHYLEVNDGYLFSSYGEIFRRHFFRPKDPVPHPRLSQD